jgi:hypothetical protein
MEKDQALFASIGRTARRGYMVGDDGSFKD